MLGPLGEFQIPETPDKTRDHVRTLTQQVFDGEYDHTELPTAGIRKILDIGCGWGAFAVWAYAKWLGAEIVGYDPHGEALQYFRRNAPFATGIQRAITIDGAPFYGVSWEWGSGHTRGRSDGIRVPAMHPRELPPCDVIKIDAEGVEPEVLEHYAHTLKALIYEYHSPKDAEVLRSLCEARQLRNLRHDTTDYGTAIWVPRES